MNRKDTCFNSNLSLYPKLQMCIHDTAVHKESQRSCLRPAEPCVGHSKRIPNKPKILESLILKMSFLKLRKVGWLICIKHQNYSVELQTDWIHSYLTQTVMLISIFHSLNGYYEHNEHLLHVGHSTKLWRETRQNKTDKVSMSRAVWVSYCWCNRVPQIE